MVSPILYAKVSAIIALVIALFGAGYHFGGISTKADEDRLREAQIQKVADGYQNQLAALEASTAKQQVVIDAYDAKKDVPNPIDVGLAHRVYIRSLCPDVPAASAVAGGTQAPAALPAGDPGTPGRVELAIQGVIDAARADANQLQAMIELAP